MILGVIPRGHVSSLRDLCSKSQRPEDQDIQQNNGLDIEMLDSCMNLPTPGTATISTTTAAEPQ